MRSIQLPDVQGGTYSEENIRTVHQHHDNAPNASEIASIARNHEYDGDDMMDHHLDVILSPSLSIEDQHLVEVKGDLGKIIKFDGTRQGDVRVVQPQVCRIHHSGGKVVMDILGQLCVRPGCLLASHRLIEDYSRHQE